MQLIPKPIRQEEFHYYSEKSLKNLKMEMDYIFKHTQGWNFSINMSGKFVSENLFKITPKWQFGVIQSFETWEAYLNGRIYEDAQKRACVTFTVRPNSIYPIFFFLLLLFAFIMMLVAIKNNNTQEGQSLGEVLYALVFMILFLPIFLVLGYFAKRRLKNTFVSTFKLKPLE